MFKQIVKAVEEAAKAVNPDGIFFEGRIADTYQTQNEQGDAIHLYPFITTDTDNGLRTELKLGFWRHDSTENGIEERRAIIASMFTLSKLFTEELEAHPDIEFKASPQREPQYQSLSPNYSGYFVTVDIEIFEVC